MPISVISTEDNNNFTNIELPQTETADTDVNHLQEEQFSSSVCDPSSQDDSVQAFPEQVVAKKFFMRVISLIFLISISLSSALEHNLESLNNCTFFLNC